VSKEFTPKLVVGVGVFCRLKEELEVHRSEKVLFIVEPTFKELSFLYKINSFLKKQGFQVRMHFVPKGEETIQNPYKLPDLAYDATFDTVIGLGNNELLNYTTFTATTLERLGLNKKRKITLFLIPSTPTTGIEASGKFYTYENNMRHFPFKRRLYPAIIFYDPLITIHIPLLQLIRSSVITLAKAIEHHYNSATYRKLTTSSIQLIVHHLVRASYHRKDLEAREALLRAGMFLGLSSVDWKRISLIDCFVLPVYQKVQVSVATVTAVMLPYVVKLYREIDEQREREILLALGYTKYNKVQSSSTLSYRLVNVFKGVGFPIDLRSIGVKEKDLDELAFTAYGLWMREGYCSKELTEESFYSLYREAYAGNIESFFE